MALGANRICTLLLIACDTHCYHNTMADLALMLNWLDCSPVTPCMEK